MTRHIPVPTKDAPLWAAELTLKQRRFVEEFIVDLNGRAAGVRAGLGKSPKSAGEIAAKLRKIPAVAAAISALMAEKHGVAATAIVSELGAVAYARMTDFMTVENGRVVVRDTALWTDEQKAAVSEIWETTDGVGYRVIRIKLHDKLVALDRLGKSIGLFKEKSESTITHQIEFTDPMARIKERLASLRRSQQDGAEPRIEIDAPAKRAAIPAPRRTPPTIDG
jgi:phage terminase small subunit